MDRQERIVYLLKTSRALLVRADALIMANTEYLRDELNTLLEGTDTLLEKVDHEQELLHMKEMLHAEHQGTVGEEQPTTGVRPRP